MLWFNHLESSLLKTTWTSLHVLTEQFIEKCLEIRKINKNSEIIICETSTSILSILFVFRHRIQLRYHFLPL